MVKRSIIKFGHLGALRGMKLKIFFNHGEDDYLSSKLIIQKIIMSESDLIWLKLACWNFENRVKFYQKTFRMTPKLWEKTLKTLNIEEIQSVYTLYTINVPSLVTFGYIFQKFIGVGKFTHPPNSQRTSPQDRVNTQMQTQVASTSFIKRSLLMSTCFWNISKADSPIESVP